MAIREVFYRSPHNYDVDAATRASSVRDFGPSLTVQSQAEDLDLNVIMERFGVTGKMPESFVAPMYGDFEQVFDFRTANESAISARHAFESLPWKLKDRFAQDPQRLLEFVADDGNMDEALRLGLLSQEKYDARVKANAGKQDSSAGAGAGAVAPAAAPGGEGGKGGQGAGASAVAGAGAAKGG